MTAIDASDAADDAGQAALGAGIGAADSAGPGPLWERWNRERPESPRRARWLAEARRGAGKEAGTVPVVWPLYQGHEFRGHDAHDDKQLQADHICLVMFAFHQQSHDDPVHRPGVAFGVALRKLRESTRFRERETALDAKVYAAATATSLFELQSHLRALAALLKAENIGLDYGRLYRDLVTWQQPGGADRVRQSWGRDYYWRPAKDASPSVSTSSKGQSS